MNIESILSVIFKLDEDLPQRNPNDPADQPFLAIKPAIENQAFNAWCREQGGEVVLDEIRKMIRGQVIAMIGFPIRGLDDVFKFLTLRQKTTDDFNWYLKIIEAFEKHEEKKQGSLKGG